MDLTDVPILSMLKGRMGYLTERQRVIAENVANADTPGYMARDLKPTSFQAHLQAQGSSSTPGVAPAGTLAVTQPGHMQPPGSKPGMKAVKAPDSEETLDGNGVVLEDQMVKLTDTRMEFDATVGVYQQANALLKLAVKRPGSS
ncbi:flagellar basal body protein [Phenylobacterium sp.]|uniref:flagellar basal body protein n=1 Tax=Phenylobacterium sp. TaxID=1871053 RepID=UPI00122ABC02|nr:flagellar basal body protein [Phenylobacterium sp.]THD62256.1 MAG: flagellar basal body rod protein FlgB [Phenylobacterium sp.]